MREIDKILDKEKILWEGKPKLLPFLFSSIFTTFSIILLIYLILLIRLKDETNSSTTSFIIITLVLFAPIIYKFLSYFFIHYAITDKRVILQGGIIGRDFRIIEFDKITNLEVNVNLFDKIFGGNSGSILIQTPEAFRNTRLGPMASPHKIKHIKDPYEVFKLFKNLSFNVKTDINFPNLYRPKKNKGYRTEYSKST